MVLNLPTSPTISPQLKPDPFTDLRKTSPLAREASIGVGGGVGTKKSWGLKREDSLESIGEITGFRGPGGNFSPRGSAQRTGSFRRSDSNTSSGSGSDGVKRRVSFHKDVKPGKYEHIAVWYRGVMDNFADLSFQKCAMQCGNNIKALDSVLSEVRSCAACGNLANRNHRCAHCGLPNGKCGPGILGEQNDLVWKPSHDELRDALNETRDVIQESRDAIVASKIAVSESRDAILGSYKEMKESREAIQESRHAISDCRDAIMKSRQPDTTEKSSRRSHLNPNTETGMGNVIENELGPFTASVHANQKQVTPRSILKKTMKNNLVISSSRKSTKQMDMLGAAALPSSTALQYKRNQRKTSSWKPEEAKTKPGQKMKQGVTRLFAGSLKAPLKLVAHRMTKSSARPRRVLAIKSSLTLRHC